MVVGLTTKRAAYPQKAILWDGSDGGQVERAGGVERHATSETEVALPEQGDVAVGGERLGAALLAIDEGDDGGDLQAGLLRPADRLQGGGAGRDDVLEDGDAGAAGDVVLDDAPGAVLFRVLADQEGAERP